jgi:fibronectin-binding autotransporter adhesin
MNNSTIAHTLTRGIRLSVVAALLTGTLAVTQPARAKNYIVLNTNNSGKGSLRTAINFAKNNPGADTITFAAATDGIPIILAGAAGEDANVSGDLDILDGGDLTIQGNRAKNTIIDGGGIDRVFHICPAGGCANTVTFIGVTIRNGNTATSGGGIYNKATLNVQNGSTVSANTATLSGGGIYNLATLYVQNGSTVSANTATYYGGGIYNWGGTTTVDGSTVSANTAGGGGGISNATTLYVQNGSTIGGASTGNTADSGGGIYNYGGGTTTVDGSTVSANTANDDGGGIHNAATLNVQNGSTIGGVGAGNTTTNHGGGIFNLAGSVTVDGSTVSANTAIGGGGGIRNLATLNVTNSTIGGTEAGNTANSGGGIFNWDGTTTVTDSRILNNTANTDGGGVYNYINVAGATSVTGSCIVGNSAWSFYNNQPALQIATGNWWGAATGPNTPGADTYGGNVDVSGHLTEPILGCGLNVYLPLVLR